MGENSKEWLRFSPPKGMPQHPMAQIFEWNASLPIPTEKCPAATEGIADARCVFSRCCARLGSSFS